MQCIDQQRKGKDPLARIINKTSFPAAMRACYHLNVALLFNKSNLMPLFWLFRLSSGDYGKLYYKGLAFLYKLKRLRDGSNKSILNNVYAQFSNGLNEDC